MPEKRRPLIKMIPADKVEWRPSRSSQERKGGIPDLLRALPRLIKDPEAEETKPGQDTESPGKRES